MTRFDDQEKIQACLEVMPDFEEFIVRNLNGGQFLSGNDQPMMLDFHVYPMLERVVMLENSPWHKGFEALNVKECPQMISYVERFRTHPLMSEHVIT